MPVMPEYRINQTSQGVAIELTDVGDRQDALLESFGVCAQGRCGCPTDEYQKVETMHVRPGADRIDIELQAKPGERFDASEIAACLDYTVTERQTG